MIESRSAWQFKSKVLKTSFVSAYTFYKKDISLLKKYIILLLKNEVNFAKKLAKDIQSKKTFTRYLFKQDYKEPLIGTVTIDHASAMRTNAIKKIPWTLRVSGALLYQIGRSKKTLDENRNAVLECVANDIARAMKIECQEQSLVFGTYKNGNLKIVSRSKWEDDLKPLGAMAGGNYEEGNYLVKPLNLKGQSIKYVSDNSISDLGEHLVTIISQSDRDVLGSRLQNKMQRNNRLFGFDFGHAYRDSNPLLATLKDDFRFKQPKNNIFKNLSIFYDTPLREKMRGIHYLNKMFKGIEPSDEIKREYGKDFTKKVESIDKGKDQEIFDGFIKTFRGFQKDAEEEIKVINEKLKLGSKSRRAMLNKEIRRYTKQRGQIKKKMEEFDKLVTALGKSKANALLSHYETLKVFNKRLSLTPTQLDVLDALEKLTSKTSLLSPDETVLLQYMRTIRRVKWDMQVKGNICTISTKHMLQMKKVVKYLGAEPQNSLDKRSIKFSSDDEGLKISFPLGEMKNIAKIFNEVNVQKYKHKQHYELRQSLGPKKRENVAHRLGGKF